MPKKSTRRRPVTPEDLLRFVLVGDPQLSPDGRHVLFTRKHIGDRNDYRTDLWIAPTDGSAARAFTSGGKDSHGRWSPDGSRIAFIRATKGKTAQLYTIPAHGGEAAALTSLPEGVIASFAWSPDGTSIAMLYRPTHPDWTEEARKTREENGAATPPRIVDDLWYRLDGDGYFLGQRFALHLVDATTGARKLINAKDTLGDISYDFSPDGKTIALTVNSDPRALERPWKTTIQLYDIASGRLRAVEAPKGPKSNVIFSPDGRRLAWAGREDRCDGLYSTENLRLFITDLTSGETRDLTGDNDDCLMAVTLSDASEAKFAPSFRWHPDSRRLFMRLGRHGDGRIASVSIKGGKFNFHTGEGEEYSLGNFSKDGSRLALVRSTSVELPEIALAGLTKSRFETRVLTAFNRPLLDELDIIAPTSHWVESTDGVKVQVWVLKPRSTRKNGKVPAVLEIHGGPHAQYGVPFFHEFQVLAAAGYAVFYSNPRGSKGYGRDFCHAIRGAWGTKDWEDIQAVTGFIRRQKWVNTKRMGVMGGSYGGYMTNWVIGHTREFAGAITDRCVSNLVSMGGNSDYPDIPDKYWPGDFWSRPEALWQCSPIRLMGAARTPTLIIHSEGDLRCNIEQAEQVFTVLQLHGVPSRFIRYPATTSHGMSRMGPPDLRLHRLREILNWWKRYLG